MDTAAQPCMRGRPIRATEDSAVALGCWLAWRLGWQPWVHRGRPGVVSVLAVKLEG